MHKRGYYFVVVESGCGDYKKVLRETIVYFAGYKILRFTFEKLRTRIDKKNVYVEHPHTL